MTTQDVATSEIAISLGKPSSGTSYPVFVRCALVAFGYSVGTALGLFLTPRGEQISVLWPPNAILLAAMLLTAKKQWTSLLLAVLPVHLLIQHSNGIPIATAVGWYATNVSEAVVGAALLKRYIRSDRMFSTFQGVIGFIILGVFFAPFITSFLDATVVVLTGWGQSYWSLWEERFFSNMLSNLMFVPPIVVIGSEWKKLFNTSRARHIEFLTVALVTVAVAYVVLGSKFTGEYEPALLYLFLPILLWTALRFGCAGVSGTLLLGGLLTIWYSSLGIGPFAGELHSLQAFLTAVNVPFLCLAAVLEERSESENALRKNQQMLGIVSQTAATFVNLEWEKVDVEIKRALDSLRNGLHADRVTVFLVSNGNLSARYSTVDPADRSSGHRQAGELEWLQNKLPQRETTITTDASDTDHKQLLKELGLSAVAVVPIKHANVVYGALSIAWVTRSGDWDSELFPLVQVFGDIIHDAVQRKHAIQAMKESEERFRQIADEAPMFIWMTDTGGMCTYVNRAWIEFTGIDFAEQLRCGWQAVVHPEDVEELLTHIKDAHAFQNQFSAEYRARRRDGSYRWILAMGVARFDQGGKFEGLVGSAVDITDRKKAEEVVRTFTGRLINAQESERIRIARELHDDIGQQLALLAIQLDKMRGAARPEEMSGLNKLSAQAESISQSVRQVSHGLHTASLDALSLETALYGLCRDCTSAELHCRFIAHGTFTGMPIHVKVCLYRVAQTALQNVVRHSHAHHARVDLTGKDDMIHLVIQDDGVGFDLSTAFGEGLGLQSIRERLRSLGGLLRISSSSKSGTRIEAQLSRRAHAPESLRTAA